MRTTATHHDHWAIAARALPGMPLTQNYIHATSGSHHTTKSAPLPTQIQIQIHNILVTQVNMDSCHGVLAASSSVGCDATAPTLEMYSRMRSFENTYPEGVMAAAALSEISIGVDKLAGVGARSARAAPLPTA